MSHLDSNGQTFEVWSDGCRNRTDNNNLYWKRIGDWMYPTRDNKYWHTFHHICYENFLQESKDCGVEPNSKCVCGELVPDGIKMVVLLMEKL